MLSLGEWYRRVHYLLHRRELEDQLRLDMEAHRAMMGTPARFGNTLRLREEAHDTWGWRWLHDLGHDLRHGLRSFVADRAYTTTAVTTLALGIGTTAAVFTVVNGVLLRPLPFPDAGRLVQVSGQSALAERGAVPDVDGLRRGSGSFAAIAGYEVAGRYLRTSTGSTRVMAVQAEGDFFSVLGAAPRLGRTFTASDPPDAAVIGEEFWRRDLESDPNVIGRTLAFTDRSVTIVGVMPRSFQFPYAAASILPGVASAARTDVWLRFPGGRVIHRIGEVVGRIKADVSIEAAAQEAAAVGDRLAAEAPHPGPPTRVIVEPLADAIVTPPVQRLLALLFGSVVLLLALACANVGTLALARVTRRSQHVAVRVALGAGRGRLMRQALAESLLLLSASALAGLVLAWFATRWFLTVAAAYLPRAHDVALDWRVVGFVIAAAAVVGIMVALIPMLAVLGARDAHVQSSIREGAGRATAGPAASRLRDSLIVAEIAIAFVLAVGAALLVRELVRLKNVDPGVSTRNVMTFHLGYRGASPPDPRQFYAIEDRVRQLPGTAAAGVTQLVPLQNWGWTSSSSDFAVRGRPRLSPEFPIQMRYVTPGYLATLRVAVRSGRGFTADDTASATPAVVINETLARRCCAGFDPVGQITNRGTIVGVVADVRQASLDRPAEPELYFPIAQNWSQISELGMTLLVRTTTAPAGLTDVVRSVVHDVNPDLAVFDVKGMDQVIADSLAEFTLYLSVVTAFAALALVLAASGTYGVIAYLAASRTQEFAVRAALGARRAAIARLVLARGARIVGLGLLIGLAGALAASSMVVGLPVKVREPDLETLAPLAAALFVLAMTASLLPAIHASRVDPVRALKAE